ncbi:undecaprenyldiphospho-muramoylpentapeptide beta-N-acetylglucosaminyltransferase [Candidatus Parcubacteria bacterium]|nr:undecaprenyldiphospho-muramoylpentapeptide beta-N-acetylglucosaminyltransferase [Candidatus Parcubacteria bacterium]
MKILLTGGGSGGHFYPLISVAQKIRKEAEKRKILQPKIYYVAENPYDEDLLFRNDIIFKQLSSGKLRNYFSVLNFFDLFKTAGGIIKAMMMIFSVYPDVVFSNGGYGSFPVLFAAKFFRIPVLIHVSDTSPGRVLRWASKFAKKISVGFPEAGKHFLEEKVAYTGNPIRAGINLPLVQGAHEFLKLDKGVPTILVFGGSQGAKMINDVVVDSLLQLVEKYQIIHQTGANNFKEVFGRANLILEKSSHKERYKPFKYLDLLALRMSVGASDLVISRAGAGSISEIAVWGIPSIIVPITISSGDHQRQNAFSYARNGAAVVVEEENLTSNLLVSEINRLMEDKEKREKMSVGAKEFARTDAAEKIAEEILKMALKH